MAKSVMNGIWDVLLGQKSAWEAQEEVDESKKEEKEEGGMGLLARLNACSQNITNMNFDENQQSPMLYGRNGGMQF